MIDTAIILAAGRGSRLKEVTAHRSKALAPIAGKPIIMRVIDALTEAGVRNFIVIGAPHDTELKELCTSLQNTKFFVQETPLGSANALISAQGGVPDTFLVCACDSLIPSGDISNLIAHHTPSTDATLSIIEVAPDISLAARSVVTLKGDLVTEIIEKPSPGERISNLSSLPLYILTKGIFDEIARLKPSARGEYELPEAFRSLIDHGKIVRGVRASERYDLTDQNDLLTLNLLFLAKISPEIQISSSVKIPKSAKLIPPLLIEEGVTIGEDSTIGPLVYLERGSAVLPRVSISRSLVLRDGAAATPCDGGIITGRPSTLPTEEPEKR